MNTHVQIPKKITTGSNPVKKSWQLLRILILLVFMAKLPAQAGTYTSIASGDWSNRGNWFPEGVPATGDNVIINGHNVVVPANVNCASLTLSSAQTISGLTIGQGIALRVSGAVIVNSPVSNNANILDVNNGILSAASLTINGGTGQQFSLVKVNNGSLEISGNVNFSSGNNATLEFAGTGLFKLGGALATNGTFNAGSSSTIIFNGTTQQYFPNAFNFVNVRIENTAGVKLQNNIVTGVISGDLTIAQGYLDNDGYSLLGLPGKALTIEDGASIKLLLNSGFPGGFTTFNLKPLSEAIYQGNNQTIAALTYGRVSVKKSNTIKTLAGNCTIEGNFVLDDGVTLDMSTYQVNGGGAAIIKGYVRTAHPSGLGGAAGAFTCIGGLTLNPTCTIEYNAAGNQLITSRSDYKNLVITGSGVKSISGNITIGGVLTVNTNATLNIGAFQILSGLGNKGSMLINGTLRTMRTEGFTGSTRTAIHKDVSPVTLGAGSTIEYNAGGGGTQLITSRSDYKNVTITDSRVKVLQGNITIANKLTVSEGAFFRFDGFQVLEAIGASATAQINGIVELSNADGLANKTTSALHANITLLPLAESSNIIYNSSSDQEVTALNYGGLSIENFGQKNAVGNITIRGFLLVNEIATLDLGSYQVLAGGSVLARPSIAINGVLRTSRPEGFSGTSFTTISEQFEDVWLNTSSNIVYYGASQFVSPRNDYGIVTLEGGQTKVLNGTTAINTMLDLGGGSLDIGNYTLIIESTGVVSNASNTFYIIQSGTGKLLFKNIGIEPGGRDYEMLFPVGTPSSYTPAYITNVGPNNSFSVKVANGIVDDAGQPITFGVVNRTWDIKQETNNGTANVTMRLQWNAQDELVDFDRNFSAISHYEMGSGGWHRISNFSAAAGADPYSATATGVTAFSPFGVGSGISPLPVELVFFKASRKGESALLEWQTAAEKNNQGFEIQASSDGKNYTRIGFVESLIANSQTTQNYSYTDAQGNKTGLWYYRLKQIDLDGTTAFSEAKVVDFGKSRNDVSVYPNPFAEQFAVKFQSSVATEALISIHDLSGKTVYSAVENLSAGNNLLQLQVGNRYATGLYILTIQAADQVYTTRVIKN